MSDEIIRTIQEVIRKQSIILGPDIAIYMAREVPELDIDDEGKVISIKGNPRIILQRLVDKYVSLSGEIVRKAMESLLADHHDVDAQPIGGS